jgi:hypothetical protein
MQNEQRNQRLMMANNPMANAQYMMARNGGMTNGKPTELQRTAHMNNRPYVVSEASRRLYPLS